MIELCMAMASIANGVFSNLYTSIYKQVPCNHACWRRVMGCSSTLQNCPNLAPSESQRWKWSIMQKMGPHNIRVGILIDVMTLWSSPAAIDDLDTNCGEKSQVKDFLQLTHTRMVETLQKLLDSILKASKTMLISANFRWVKGSQLINDFYVPSST